MAKMHLASKGFLMSRANDLTLANWQQEFKKIKPDIDGFQKGLSKELETELDRLNDLWPTYLPHGVIHGDLFPDNVFFQGSTLSGVIDFYFACSDFYIYELAICINAWCFESSYEFNITKAHHLLSSYNKVRPISSEELEALPILASGCAMRFLLTRLDAFIHQQKDALVTPKDPQEYIDKLRFHRNVKSYHEYGL